MQWVAVKIARHEHDAGQPVWEETKPGERTDTARYLAAGAGRAFLLTAVDGPSMQSALEELWTRIDRTANFIFESNRILNFVRPDVCLMVRPAAEGGEAKTSFENVASLADAVVIGGTANVHREGPRPEFELEQLEHISPSMEHWIRGRLIYG
jgi:hypothetical protein